MPVNLDIGMLCATSGAILKASGAPSRDSRHWCPAILKVIGGDRVGGNWHCLMHAFAIRAFSLLLPRTWTLLLRGLLRSTNTWKVTDWLGIMLHQLAFVRYSAAKIVDDFRAPM
jgi:hypothetical protein